MLGGAARAQSDARTGDAGAAPDASAGDASAAGGEHAEADDAASRPLRVGSKDFTENRILAEVLAQLLRAETGLAVEVRDNLGGTLAVFAALRAGEIDLYPEYTGTGWAVVLGEQGRPPDPLSTYAHVAREYSRRFDVDWMLPFGFSNSYALAVRDELAESMGLATISDLLPHAGELRAAVSHEFLNRDDGWPGLSAAYGLQVGELRGMEHGLAFEAVASGDVDLIDAWTTDGKLLRFPVTVLEDDKGFFPPYHAAPIVRGETLRAHPEIGPALARLAGRLPNARMQALNLAVEADGRSYRDVARDFLRDEGLVADDGTALAGVGAGDRRGDLLAFVRGRLGVTARLLGEHLWLTGFAVLLATLFAVPLGIALARRETAAKVVLGAAGVIQTVPSLALLAFMIPVLGIGATAALAALFLYALLPILRNTYTGLREVDADLVKAARGLGLTDAQVLRHVELPLAMRTIMAGVRTSAVISVGVATLAAFIGAGGLGEPIVTGLQLNDTRLVLAGAVPAALLAVVVDALLGYLERHASAVRVG
ncbi:MAG: ABC transporter permease subunit [Planctomycetes bacterium]|nr:ABC transporter permease subunit [Planctomycetota bacterium]